MCPILPSARSAGSLRHVTPVQASPRCKHFITNNHRPPLPLPVGQAQHFSVGVKPAQKKPPSPPGAFFPSRLIFCKHCARRLTRTNRRIKERGMGSQMGFGEENLVCQSSGSLFLSPQTGQEVIAAPDLQPLTLAPGSVINLSN